MFSSDLTQKNWKAGIKEPKFSDFSWLLFEQINPTRNDHSRNLSSNILNFEQLFRKYGVRASAKNKYTIWLVLWPVYCVASAGTYPQICTGGCALYTDQNTARSCAFVFCRDPYNMIRKHEPKVMTYV